MGVELENLGQSIKRLQHRHHRTADARLAPLGVTLVQWDALRAISQHPDVSAHKLAQITFQTDQSFGALASRMEARGLIERVTGSGRALRHRLTPLGEDLLGKGRVVFNEMLSESFSPLLPEERDILYNLLARLLHRSDELAGE
ncbi:MarR family winged helix-turn-helix transcriptional regulator [Ktedonospora formicarum]|uniref:MarR family transcriptional regulator n=1 Tax=Ktedonospora formicarum TaxID=2778364 RepID=A0A8J3HWG7_9CHLR|nr:MarR family transcriptional regulator [Ktedonospora formicarum]GHO42113.1 MarR family transcriptional regulator [Ktedonospora formicarum]